MPTNLSPVPSLELENARLEVVNSVQARRHTDPVAEKVSKIEKVAFLGDYLPRKCGIATFTSDLLTSVAAEYPESRCFAVPVNDIDGGYDYPDVVRFEVEEQDLMSYHRAADFININNVDIVCIQHELDRKSTRLNSSHLGISY